MMGPIVRIVITLIAGLLAWNLSRNLDGPIVHWVVTGLAVFLVWGWSAGIAGGMSGGEG